MKRIKRAYFTLLELLVVLFILSLVTAVTGVKVAKLYTEQRFLFEVQQVASHLQLAQDLMLMLDIDTTVHFKWDDHKKAIVYQFVIDEPLTAEWAQLVRDTHQLNTIQYLEFGDTKVDSEAGIALAFFSRGMCMSQGRLILAENKARDDNKAYYQINLQGYPHAITSQIYQENSNPAKQNLFALSQVLYPKELIK